jgi:hypothetical protein
LTRRTESSTTIDGGQQTMNNDDNIIVVQTARVVGAPTTQLVGTCSHPLFQHGLADLDKSSMTTRTGHGTTTTTKRTTKTTRPINAYSPARHVSRVRHHQHQLGNGTGQPSGVQGLTPTLTCKQPVPMHTG